MTRLPKDDLKKQDILKKIAEKFEKDKIYNETEINKIIKSNCDDDHVLVRRELLNFGYIQRDPYKGTYWLLTKELSKEKLDKIGNSQKKLNNSNVY